MKLGWIAVSLGLVALSLSGCETAVSCEEIRSDEPVLECWQQHEGFHWEEYESGYHIGWEEGCHDTLSWGDGALYYGDDAIDVDDCMRAERGPIDDPPEKVPEVPNNDGYYQGRYESCLTVFNELAGIIDSDGSLFFGDEEFDVSDCPPLGSE